MRALVCILGCVVATGAIGAVYIHLLAGGHWEPAIELSATVLAPIGLWPGMLLAERFTTREP